MADNLTKPSPDVSAPAPEMLIGRQIMKTLAPAENSVDVAIAGTSQLLATVAAGRASSGVGIEIGGTAMRSFWNGIGALISAREHIQAGHGQLATIRDALGMSPGELGCSATKGGGMVSHS